MSTHLQPDHASSSRTPSRQSSLTAPQTRPPYYELRMTTSLEDLIYPKRKYITNLKLGIVRANAICIILACAALAFYTSKVLFAEVRREDSSKVFANIEVVLFATIVISVVAAFGICGAWFENAPCLIIEGIFLCIFTVTAFFAAHYGRILYIPAFCTLAVADFYLVHLLQEREECLAIFHV